MHLITKRITPLVVFGILVVDLLAFTSILPLFPSLIDYYGSVKRKDRLYECLQMFCHFFQNIIGTPSSLRLHSVFFGGVLGSLYSILQFISSPLLGALSDVHGRKPILIISIIGTLLSYTIWAYLSTTFTWFVISRIIGGLSRTIVSMSTTMMSDIYPPNKAGKGMAIIGSAFSVGFLVGPMVGVYFSQTTNFGSEMGFERAAKFAILVTIIELIIVATTLPETLNLQKRKILASKLFEDCSLYIKPSALFGFSVIANRSGKTHVEKMQIYGRAYFTYLFLYSGLEFTLSFLTHTRFNYNSMQQGKMYLFIGILMIFVQGGIVRRVTMDKHHSIAVYGILLTALAYITIGYSNCIEIFYGGLALYAIASGMVVPCMTTCMANLAAPEIKGATIGVFRSLGALARAIGPFFASTVFWLLGPTVCYIMGGLLLFLPVIMLRQVSSTMVITKKE